MRELSLHLLDILQNSISAGANHIHVAISADVHADSLCMTVSDDGSGMDNELLSKVTDPFTTTRKTRRVGLGIPLLAANCELSGGYIEITSTVGVGTELKAVFVISSIDRLPVGDVGETMVAAIMSKPDVVFDLKLDAGKQNFNFNTAEVKSQLGDVHITEYTVLEWIKDFIREGVKITFGGVLDEVFS